MQNKPGNGRTLDTELKEKTKFVDKTVNINIFYLYSNNLLFYLNKNQKEIILQNETEAEIVTKVKFSFLIFQNARFLFYF